MKKKLREKIPHIGISKQIFLSEIENGKSREKALKQALRAAFPLVEIDEDSFNTVSKNLQDIINRESEADLKKMLSEKVTNNKRLIISDLVSSGFTEKEAEKIAKKVLEVKINIPIKCFIG